MAMIPEGKHPAKAIAWGFRMVADKPTIEVTFHVLGYDPFRGTLWMDDSRPSNARDGEKTAREKSLDTLRAMGWDGVEDGKFTGIDTRPALCTVEHTQGRNGGVFANARYVNPLGSPTVAPTNAQLSLLFGKRKAPAMAPDTRGDAPMDFNPDAEDSLPPEFAQ